VGDLDWLKRIAKSNSEILHKEDANGWLPLHEGARAGHVDVVEFLVKSGAAINRRTNRGAGGTALYFARKSQGKKHPVVKLLESIGALDIGPEL